MVELLRQSGAYWKGRLEGDLGRDFGVPFSRRWKGHSVCSEEAEGWRAGPEGVSRQAQVLLHACGADLRQAGLATTVA